MVELALVLPTVVFLCFGVIDLLRFLYLESALTRAAADVAVVVQTIPNLDYDLRELTPNDAEYYDFYEARRLAVERGVRFASKFFAPPGVVSDAVLLQSVQRDDALSGYSLPVPPELVSSVLVLRPGERGEFRWDDDYGTTVVEEVVHPITAPLGDGTLPPQRMPNMLDLSPVQVELRAKLRPIVSFILPRITVRGTATVYREKGIRRTALIPPPGEELPGSATATRRTREPELFGAAPVPVEEVVGCVATAWDWKSAFQAIKGNEPFVRNTTQVGGVCPLNSTLSLPSGPIRL
jgi:hypothetical protein